MKYEKELFEEISENFNDQSLIIYLNGEYEGDDKYGRLIHDLKCTNPKEMYNEVLRKRVEYFKKTKRGKKKMCKIWDEIKNEGKDEERINSLRQVMKNYNQTLEEAMKGLGYPLSDYGKYKKLLKV